MTHLQLDQVALNKPLAFVTRPMYVMRRLPDRYPHIIVAKPMLFRFDGVCVRVSFSVKALRHE